MSDPTPAPVITEDVGQRRYVVTVDGRAAGFAAYVDRGGRRLFVHTEVDPAFEGQGIGSALVRGALAHVRERGLSIVPLCPFVAGWLEKHPGEADDLVDQAYADRLDAR